MRRRQVLFGLAAVSFACTRSPSGAVALVASSLQPWSETWAARFQLACSYGGSHNLVLQAERGAPASVLLLAYNAEVKNFSAPIAFASNQLVLVARTGEPDLRNASKVAVGDPRLAPVGKFAQEAIGRLRIEPQWVFTRDDRSAFSLLESGHVDLAVVYASDLRGRNLGKPRPLPCSPIDYYFLQRSGDSKGDALARWLKSAECKQSLRDFGLVVHDA